MKDEEQEGATPGTSWPPGIQRQGIGSAAGQANQLKPYSSAWAIVWALSAVRTISLWAFLWLYLLADETGTYDMAVINSIGYTAFPEYFLADSIIRSGKVTLDLIPLMTFLVFLDTFVIAVLFRLVVVTAYLRHSNQAGQE